MRHSFVARLVILIVVAVLLESPAAAAIFTVTSNADSGNGTLRKAITDANATQEFDEIRFNLAAGNRVITPLTSLPAMTTPMDINGTSQPGWVNAPLISLNGATAGGIGLRAMATFSAVRGLAIYGWQTGLSMESTFATVKSNYIGLTAAGAGGFGNTGTGLAIYGDSAAVGGTPLTDRNVISDNDQGGIVIGADANGALIFNNYIGTNVAGTAAIGNGSYGIRSFGAGNQIGGSFINGGNVISGNERGISLESASDTGTIVRGNIIGLNAAGTAKLFSNGSGIELNSNNNTIGGSLAGEGNTISGNKYGGITIGDNRTGNVIQGNYIGLDDAGTAAVGNESLGIDVRGDGNQIGGTAVGAGNVISGNAGGIDCDGMDNLIQGNRVGTNAAGTADLGNAGSGVRVFGTDNQVGGSVAGAGNLISGNGSGIIVSDATGAIIQGNRVGLNVTGTAAIGNDGYALRVITSTGTIIGGAGLAGNVFSGNSRGVALDDDAPGNDIRGNIIGLAPDGITPIGNNSSGLEVDSGDNLIGDAQTGNIISGNQRYGIVFAGEAATNNLVQGNKIGVAADGVTLRGNYYNILFYGASGNTLGGVEPGEGNVVAASTNAGAYVWFGTHNRLSGNSFFSNGGLGIDHDEQGIFEDDILDGDTGSNEQQNLPVLYSVLTAGADYVISGKLRSRAETTYDVEFFSSPACDPSGFGEGKTYLGTKQVTTDAAGNAQISATVAKVGIDTIITATATSPEGDTSEFSPCATVDAGADAGALQFSQDVYLGYEEEGSVTVSVVRTGGASGAVSVHYTTVDDTATAPGDYETTSGTLSFADGEVVKSFQIPLVLDGPDSGDQEIGLLLSAPTGGAILGSQAESHVLLFDYSQDFPGVYISNVSVSEGDDGTTNADFEVTLTPTDHVVTFKVRTTAATATAGEDFEPVEVNLSFNPGEAPKTVSVPILGDVDDEDIEVFYLLVSGQIQPGGYAGDFGHGYILDDDGDAECGNLAVQAPETCDDGDLLYTLGDYCSTDCVRFPCGIPTKIDGVLPKASDALFVLKAAVQGTNCHEKVCDVNDSGNVSATDSLIILKRAVGQGNPVNCPA